MRVALTAIATFAQDEFLPWLGEIGDGLYFHFIALGLARTADHRADRDLDVIMLGTPAMFVLSLTMPSTLGADQWFEKQCHQAVHIMVGHQDDIAALASITTIRTAARDELFTAKAAATIPTITRFGVHADLINKFHARKMADMTRQVEPELEKQGSFECGSPIDRVLWFSHEQQALD
jgi:hypothetical protein